MRTHACLRGHRPRTLNLSSGARNACRISTGDNDQAWRGSPALTEPSRVTGFERLRHLLAFDLANDQPGGRGGERQADMLMAVAAIDVGESRRPADRRTEVG